MVWALINKHWSHQDFCWIKCWKDSKTGMIQDRDYFDRYGFGKNGIHKNTYTARNENDSIRIESIRQLEQNMDQID